jgi:hypothetical protein
LNTGPSEVETWASIMALAVLDPWDLGVTKPFLNAWCLWFLNHECTCKDLMSNLQKNHINAYRLQEITT